MNYRDQLILDNFLYKVLETYEILTDEYTGYALDVRMSEWKLAIFDFGKSLDKDQVQYIINKCRQENYRVYLELQYLFSKTLDKSRSKKSIFKLFDIDIEIGDKLCKKENE